MPAIVPGSTIGILGGGELGRMTALAARSMGYRVHVLDPDAECSASPVVDRCVTARFDDVDAARELARHCDVVTLEIEQSATDMIDAANAYAPARPGSHVVGIVQDRARQKAWLTQHGFPVAEKALSLAGELSVMVARRPGGDVTVFPAALNHHEREILVWSVIPAPLPKELIGRAVDIGRGIAEKIELEGLIAVELFLTTSGELFVNELAPRPHNSFHASERACVTSQFEQLTRAVCDLPLGDVSVVRPAAIVNLFGDLWREGRQPDFIPALREDAVRLHLYGKREARAGHKMGHLSAIGGSAFDALTSVTDAAAKIGVVLEPWTQAFRAHGSGT
jgi:5-(carboxyamino)imidazole ribonucleotide synthase